MSAIYKNGIAYGGAASAANLISATDAEGAATNVQAELDNINENISSLNDNLANYATKSETLRTTIIRSSVTSGQMLAAGDWKDYDTGVTITGTLVAYIAQYSGHPKCVIVNIWTSATNTVNVTIYNPSSTAQSLGEIRILELYKN